MKKIIPFLISLFFLSCFTKDKQIKHFTFADKSNSIINMPLFVADKTYKVPKIDRFVKKGLFESDSGLNIIGFKYYTNEIVICNIETGNYKTLNIDYKKEPINDFNFINEDSIFLFFQPDAGGKHDSLIVQTDIYGNLNSVFSVYGKPVYSSKFPQYNNNDDAVFWVPNFYGNSYSENKIFLHFVSSAEALGETFYKGLPIFGILDLTNNKFRTVDKIDYPIIKYGETFFPAPSKQFNSIIGHNGNVFCTFKYTPTIVEYDYKQDSIKYHKIKSSVIDSVFAYNSKKSVPEVYEPDISFPVYTKLVYDKYRNYYYLFVRYPKQFSKQNRQLNSMIILDDNLNRVAEGFAPRFTGKFLLSKKHLISYSGETQSGDSLIYTAYQLKFKKGTNSDLINRLTTNEDKRAISSKITTGSLKKIVKSRGIEVPENYTLSFISYNKTCNNTFDFYMNHYKTNNKHYKKNDVYLYIFTDHPKETEQLLSEKYGLDLKNNANIFIDSTQKNRHSFDAAIGNLARTIVIRESKIKSDTVFDVDSSGLIDFQKFIINSGKEQMRLKENPK